MSKDDAIGKALGNWIGKAPRMREPPKPHEARNTLQQPERAQTRDDDLVQLNFKIPVAVKRRIKLLAVRDNITLLAMLSEMVELYEREHGQLPTK